MCSHCNKWRDKYVVRYYLHLVCCRFLWVSGAHRWVEHGVSPTERPDSPPAWHWPPPEPGESNTQVSTKSEHPTVCDNMSPASSIRDLTQPTWSFSRLLSASGKRSIVFFLTCFFSSFSQFPSSLCFNSSNTYTKTHHTCETIIMHLCSFCSFCACYHGSPHLVNITPNTSVLTFL